MKEAFDLGIIKVYAPTTDSTEVLIEDFYNNIELAMSYCKSQDIVIVQGDFNAKVGNERSENFIG